MKFGDNASDDTIAVTLLASLLIVIGLGGVIYTSNAEYERARLMPVAEMGDTLRIHANTDLPLP